MMNRKTQAAAVIGSILYLLCLPATPAGAARVQLVWDHPGDAQYEAFVGQPEIDAPDIVVYELGSAARKDGDTFTWTLDGIDPARHAYFLVAAVDSLGRFSGPSEIIEVTPRQFCGALDVDHRSGLSVVDALKVLRVAVGLPAQGVKATDVKASDAHDILRLATAGQCV